MTDDVTPTPESSYGAQKVMCEILINDMSRRGFIDGLVLRFPTISIRPGKPTAAASSFLSGIIREPLNGLECVIPIQDKSFKSWLCSPRTLCENLIIALGFDTKKLPPHIRQLNLPGTSVSIQEMLDALEEVGGPGAVKLVRAEKDEAGERILRSWAVELDASKAESLGFVKDPGFMEAVKDYKAGLKVV